MAKKQTTWEEKFDNLFTDDITEADYTNEDIKQFISKTISQEKEKWATIIRKEKRLLCPNISAFGTCDDCSNEDQEKNEDWNEMIDDLLNLLQNK